MKWEELTDSELLDETASAILAAAVMNGRRGAGRYHDYCDAAYAECQRRNRLSIYDRAYNSVAVSQGYKPGPVRKDEEDDG